MKSHDSDDPPQEAKYETELQSEAAPVESPKEADNIIAEEERKTKPE